MDIAGALGLRQEEVFRFAYPDLGEEPSEAAKEVRKATSDLGGVRLPAATPAVPAAPPPPILTEADVERIVAKALRRILSDGTPPDEK